MSATTNRSGCALITSLSWLIRVMQRRSSRSDMRYCDKFFGALLSSLIKSKPPSRTILVTAPSIHFNFPFSSGNKPPTSCVKSIALLEGMAKKFILRLLAYAIAEVVLPVPASPCNKTFILFSRAKSYICVSLICPANVRSM